MPVKIYTVETTIENKGKIEEFLSNKYIGCSEDERTSYSEHTILFENGDVKVMYSAIATSEDGFMNKFELTESKPYIANPQVEDE